MRVSAIQVRALVDAVNTKRVSAQTFCDRAGIDIAKLSSPSAWFSEDEFDALLLLALEVTGDAAFGLHWGEHAVTVQYDVLPPLVSQSKTLRKAITSILRFQHFLADRPEVEFTERRGRGAFHLHSIATSAAARRVREEMTSVGLCRLVTALGATAGATVTRATFTHASPSYRDEYDRIFGRVVRFEQPACTLEFRFVTLDSATILHNEELSNALEAQAERLLERATAERTYSSRIRELVKRRLPEIPQIAEAARLLEMSERSLRRRLAEEGASYLTLVKDSQVELARSLLDNPTKTLKEVAHEVGFADATSFHRAFKRITGVAPSGYRSRTLVR